MFLAYATSRGRTLIDRRLYLPTSWTDDRDRCRRAGIDDTVGFTTKVAMAKAMVRREDRRHWGLARRSVSRPEEISYSIAYCPAGTTLDELIRIAGSRWAVEECFQTAKQECGLDDYQVRRYPGWHRHMTLAMATHACLTVLRARQLDTDKAETDPPSSSTSASPRYDG